MINLTLLHWTYLIFILIIIIFMIKRKDTSFVCLLGIFIIAFIATHSMSKSIISIFNSLIYSIKELGDTILVISLITAMSKVLEKTGVNKIMVSPFTKIIKTPTLAYWTIGIIMMITSWFFWPSPAVALIGAVLLPIATKVGLPVIGVAIAMNLFGHGIALSSDFVIQAAPKLTAGGAGIPVEQVIYASIPIVIVMGLVTTTTAFFILKKDMKNKKDTLTNSNLSDYTTTEKNLLSLNQKKFFSLLVYALFTIDIYLMFKFNLKGGDATALIGGTAIFIYILVSLISEKEEGLQNVTTYFVEGLQFGFKVFGPVIPIAAFFYLGDSGILEIIGKILPANSHGLVNDLGIKLAQTVPLNSAVGAITVSIVGAITGLDGSGFSGISLAGSVASLFGKATGCNIASLTALGQISGIWVGGGTLIPWAVIPVAAICNIDAFELARRNIIPVFIGLLTTTIFTAIFLL